MQPRGSWYYRLIQNPLERLRYKYLMARQYLALRRRVLLLSLAIKYPKLLVLVRQDKAPGAKFGTKFLEHCLTPYFCENCSEAHGRPVTYPLGHCSMMPHQEEHGFTTVVQVLCPVCNCVNEDATFFDFRQGRFFTFFS